MSYHEALKGVEERLHTINGLQHISIGRPTSVQAAPLAYVQFGGANRNERGLIANQYIVDVIVAVPYTDNAAAEWQIAPFVNTIPAAFDPFLKDDRHRQATTLGGRVNQATVTDIRSGDAEGWREIGGVIHRAITFELTITDKGAKGSGL